MSAAQRLYESGHITYMRTDSVNLSDDALNNAAKVISSFYGENYHKRKNSVIKISQLRKLMKP